ncbi:hypothetical protein BASA50_000335 [Batrachochytrium salamandrivorans]|uniref:RxLR effector protein n=1 Tax=Batrachochytrium salamandrivorans TaxID=1357716 RepID=A0ABQ8EUT0_9FUNG|nr:hypothetical protein BASA60_008172 [Batrachochytrium salamandrivorans]KAH6577292.1 hypothetical protein BASA62_000966 [Batrachochytrium salamandrivorans]KAH6586738.1 hypothetical protein BASA50_000335 [Batrachochytrium salamandrivorans]KAH6593145.1 hypothetical protein BASA61_004352 [Batrachochytrium salamandrivorans]KAH9269419.1 hypothetical protein BASA83_008502 [Batrachochytrium salamandrivorans]
MQFRHLFSFVVAASYAAASPQPAEPSEKYSSSVNADLKPGLEARSYQPGLSLQKNSADLMSLKQQDDSKGSSGKNSGSNSSPPSTLSLDKTASGPFKDDDVTSENLASTIDNVGDGIYCFYEDGEEAGAAVNGTTGEMVGRYIRRSATVNAAIKQWKQNSMSGILSLIKSGLDDDEYSEEGPRLTKTSKELEDDCNTGFNGVGDATKKIAKKVGSAADHLQKIDESFELIFSSRMKLLWILSIQLEKFKAGETLNKNLSDITTSIKKFSTEQFELYVEISTRLRTESSQ